MSDTGQAILKWFANNWIWVALGAGGLLVLSILVVVLCRYRKRKNVAEEFGGSAKFRDRLISLSKGNRAQQFTLNVSKSHEQPENNITRSQEPAIPPPPVGDDDQNASEVKEPQQDKDRPHHYRTNTDILSESMVESDWSTRETGRITRADDLNGSKVIMKAPTQELPKLTEEDL